MKDAKNNAEQEFLKELDTKLWASADKLRNNLDAANYKHVVLGPIFLKYVSDAFEERREELRYLFTQDTPLLNGEDKFIEAHAAEKHYNAAEQRKRFTA